MPKDNKLESTIKSMQLVSSDTRSVVASLSTQIEQYKETLDILILVNTELQEALEQCFKTNEKQDKQLKKLLKQLNNSKQPTKKQDIDN